METANDAALFYRMIKDSTHLEIDLSALPEIRVSFNKNSQQISQSLKAIQFCHKTIEDLGLNSTRYPKELVTAIDRCDEIVRAVVKGTQKSQGVTHAQKFTFPI